jgi:hypothetical protein
MVVATVVALLFSWDAHLYGAHQTDIRREIQARVAQAQAHAAEALGRDWKHWTTADCDAILIHSHWGEPPGMQGTLSGGLLIQLRSALPIREALLRQLQLKKHYDTLGPEQKSAFDQKNPPIMVESENDPVLLYVEHDVSYSGGKNGSVDPSQQAALELADGTLVMPTKTEALEYNTHQAVYSFPRVINGEPVLAAGDQKLSFVFGKPLPLASGSRILPLQDPSKFQMNDAKLADMRLLQRIWYLPAEMMYNGKLEY